MIWAIGIGCVDDLPRNPFPPHTTSFRFAAEAMAYMWEGVMGGVVIVLQKLRKFGDVDRSVDITPLRVGSHRAEQGCGGARRGGPMARLYRFVFST